MMTPREKELNYKTVPDGAYFHGVTIVTGDVYRLLMWNDLLGMEGNDRQVKMTFRLFDVTIKGSGLLQLMRDAKRHKIDILCVAPRSLIVMGGEGLIVKEIEVKAAE
jgi:hypothetical protein